LSPRRIDRRSLLLGGGAALGLPVLGGFATRAWAEGEPAALRNRRREAIHRGCQFLASRQHGNQGGGFGDHNGIVAITALSVLALMAEGSTDGRGPWGKPIREGLDFLLKLVESPLHAGRYPKGYFYHPQDPSSRMHGQGYATLALATALGTSTGRRDRRIRDVVRKAVECIEQAQTATGGFGYDPEPGTEHEGSVTVTVAQGLRAAHDAGVPVKEDVVRKGLYYLKRSQNNGGPEDGSFRYSTYTDRSSYALTAAALSSFFLYGRYTDDRDRTIERGLTFMMRKIEREIYNVRWFYYGNFYAAWTCWQKDGGDWTRGYWYRWQRIMFPNILERQSQSSGAWTDDGDLFDFGPLVPTAFAVLTLAIPDEVLPILQR